jgi:hypothetical protein
MHLVGMDFQYSPQLTRRQDFRLTQRRQDRVLAKRLRFVENVTSEPFPAPRTSTQRNRDKRRRKRSR